MRRESHVRFCEGGGVRLPSATRLVRSIKEECLNRVIVLGEAHLLRTLAAFVAHYHRERNHQGLDDRLISPALLDYVQALVEYTRRAPEFSAGLSPRAALALVHSARAWALIEGRDKVLPEDVQAVLPCVAGHRLRPVHDGVRASSLDKADGLISAVPIP